MAKVRVATIGRSGITERFIDAANTVDDLEYVGAYSRRLSDAQDFGSKHGASLYFDNLEDLANSNDIDAVYIASPNGLHARQAQTLLAGGKHVLVEKSFGANEQEAQAVFNLAQKNGLVALEAMRNTFGPGIKAVQASLPRLGDIRLATLRFSKVTSRIKRLRAGERLNVFDPKFAAGALMDIGVYCVEPAMLLFGKPQSVNALAVTTPVPGTDANDPYGTIDLAGEALLGYGDKVVNLTYGKVSDDLIDSQIEGEEGTLTFGEVCDIRHYTFTPHVDKGMIYGKIGGTPEETQHVDAPQNDMVFEAETFARAIQGDATALEQVAHHREVTLASLSVMDEIRRQVGVRFPADDQ